MYKNKITSLAIFCAFFILWGIQSCSEKEVTIRVGILHSLSGAMAFSEKPLVDALILAIEETNAQGGVLGRKVEIIIADGQSNSEVFAREAERLIVEEQVTVIFGCWTSACRKAVKPVVEKYQHLLFYPVQYEGMELSPDIIYTGSTPNQQITPSITWALKNLGKSFFLVGSDTIYPHTANQIIKDLLLAQQGSVLAEHYLPLGSTEVGGIIDDIRKRQPDVILNTINGDSNIAFFKALKKIKTIPVISYSIAEPEIAQINPELVQGHYVAWSYFQSIDRIENMTFVQQFKQRFGKQQLISDPMEASYIGFHLWAKAVEHAKSFEPQRIKNVIAKESFNAPEGVVAVDSDTHYLWRTARIGRVRKNGQFELVWQSDKPIRPVPYPSYRSKKTWQLLVESFSNSELEQ